MAAPKGGLHGKILDVNLTTGEIKTREVDDALYRKYIGGQGLASYFLYTEVPKGCDAYDPENLLIFAAGPTNGTQVPGSRTVVVTKSPLTNGFGSALMGGAFTSEMKWAGWDMVMFRGQSPTPVYLDIQDDNVQLRDATPFWGMDTHTAEEEIKAELEAPLARVALIGPAGENQARVACIMSERFKAAGRCGVGGVMGNKKLKAVSIRGTKSVPVADPAAFHPIANEALDICAVNERNHGFRLFGTGHTLEQNMFYVGSYAVNNHRLTYAPEVVNIGGEQAARTFWKRHAACMGCQIHCMKFGVVRDDDRFMGLITEGPEYESGVMEGSNLGLFTQGEMLWCIEYADAMGLDNIGGGGVIACAIDMMENGGVDPALFNGVAGKFGDFESVKALFEMLCHKQGKGGELLGLGSFMMAKQIADETGNAAVLKFPQGARGQNFAAHDPRGNKAQAWSYAMGPRGGTHVDGGSISDQHNRTRFSSMCMCAFVPGVWRDRQVTILVDLMNPLCGWDMSYEEFDEAGKRIITLQRAYSVREYGHSRKDDTMSDRMFEEALVGGPRDGAIWTRDEMKAVQDEYYAFFGWDDDGRPTDETLNALGLDFVAADMRG